MNSEPTIHTDHSYYPNECSCCGRRFRKPRANPKNPDKLCQDLEKEIRQQFDKEQEATRRQELNQRLIDRADYLDVIPPDKRFSPMSLADELKYQFLGQLEKLSPEERRLVGQSDANMEAKFNWFRSQMKHPVEDPNVLQPHHVPSV
jgi:hypothetical protein